LHGVIPEYPERITVGAGTSKRGRGKKREEEEEER
jgi:hypothetical protein